MDASASPAVENPEKPSVACAIGRPGGCNPVMNDDSAPLLRRYVVERSEAAFTELVQRKTGLVYSAALRQVGGDAALAQDVSQSVFIDLARKAPSLVDHPELTSWLYTSTRYAALKALRERSRRLIREQKAHAMDEIEREPAPAADWEQIRPLIDDAICDLPEHDRSAVLLRYFEGQAFATMGEKLGIGESSARMRAERALDKLRSVLAKRGITSTAAALAVVISTKAVAAPPVGLAAALAGGALAKAAAASTGAGLFAKLYQLTSLNKVPTGMAAFAAVGAAGVATYEIKEDVSATTFLVYAICFGVGLLFTLISSIGGHMFGGHGDVGGHGFDTSHGHGGGGHHGGHAQGHAEGGGGPNDMPGFAPLSPTTIATFITAFGGFGMIFQQLPATRSPWISGPLAASAALGVAALVFLLFRAIFARTQASSEGRIGEVVGQAATVITPIAPDGVGEIAYVQSGTRYSAPARADDGLAHGNGAAVKITRVVGSQFYVAAG